MEALYAYAVVSADAALPRDVDAILPGAGFALVQAGGCAALVSLVAREPFEAGPGCRGDDPAWVAARAAAHHAVVAALPGAVLPLAFGALFSGAAPLAAWLAAREAALMAALAQVEGCAECTAKLEEDPARHAAWLDEHDENLRDLARRARDATAGTAFLLARTREKRMAEARAARATMLARDVAARLGRHAHVMPEALTALVRRADLPALMDDVAATASDLAESGIALRLVGPWPPYAFARAALSHA
ncbi:GvpL/GvpF family gas vesicle protein [Falsiroseomonas sp.]|uniref:GvpL/GvpF family gas vesicle protein n=1 Tax=Falsiroseomonas sp. TaxID=2870721 RepID=UPI003F70D99A